MRNVQLCFTDEQVANVRGLAALDLAIGYLSTGALDSYDSVNIYGDRDPGDLVASYQDANTGNHYVIGAIWHPTEGRYSFHS